jgi:hypothetical protein
MILGRKDVAGRPAHLGAQRDQRFDQHRGLDRHVQRSGDARALQRLRRAIFGAQRHQAGHFGFGDRDFLAAEVGEADVGNHIVGGAVLGLRRRDCGIGGGNGGIGCGGGHGESPYWRVRPQASGPELSSNYVARPNRKRVAIQI